MNTPHPTPLVRVLFDEFHSESWSISEARAREINPDNAAVSSYQKAATALAQRDFSLARNIDQPLAPAVLANTDVLVIPHPCDPKWERTTSSGSPRFAPAELDSIRNFVQDGGGLIVISEYEHDKYGNNLNDLLAPFGLAFENTTVEDAANCVHENPEWFIAGPPEPPLAHRVNRMCYYRGCTVRAEYDGGLPLRASTDALPPRAGLIGIAKLGEGRVVAIGDSLWLGDRRFAEFDHEQLWLNLVYWCAAPAFRRNAAPEVATVAGKSEAWRGLKGAVNDLRRLQSADGSVPSIHHTAAQELLPHILHALDDLRKFFPHQLDHLAAVKADFEGWGSHGFAKPDFGAALAHFNPQTNRTDGRESLAVFPMYTPNASKDIRFEAILYRVPWPAWLAQLERAAYPNPKFAPGHLIDFTDGYRSECAVLFPETVSVAGKASNNFATIFCDREARRLQACTLRSAEIVALELHPQLECWLHSLPMIEDTVALWDLIHDQSHSLGELPFDPFMIRQRAPYWMYALEELRVDLRSVGEAARLSREGFPFAGYVAYAVLFDRIFRFPISGNRVRNYDALGGQLLFSCLHKRDVLIWSDNRLCVRWEKLFDAITALRQEIVQLYKDGADLSRVAFWIAAHDLISKYLHPNVASRWKSDSRAIHDERDPKQWVDLVHDDEFPLGGFHQHLFRKHSALMV